MGLKEVYQKVQELREQASGSANEFLQYLQSSGITRNRIKEVLTKPDDVLYFRDWLLWRVGKGKKPTKKPSAEAMEATNTMDAHIAFSDDLGMGAHSRKEAKSMAASIPPPKADEEYRGEMPSDI